MRRGGFRHAFIDIVRAHILSGQVQSNSDAARLFNVGENTIRDWRRKYPHFDSEFRVALADALATVTTRAFEAACDGDTSMMRFLLERRGGPSWQQRTNVDLTSGGNTMQALLAEHGELDMDEARERGLIIDNDSGEYGETGDEIPYYSDVEYDTDEDQDDYEYDEDGRPI